MSNPKGLRWASRLAAAAAVASGLWVACAREAAAIILYPSSPAVTDKPSDAVTVRWADNASGVVIAPNYILTTAHQGIGANFLNIAGSGNYRWAEIHQHPTADLRVVKIEKLDGSSANLTEYVRVFDSSIDGSEVGNDIVMGGNGWGRGTALSLGGTYGYNWSNVGGNGTLRWGRNHVDSTLNNVVLGALTSNVIQADFDPLASPPDDFGAVPSEAAVAQYDSGGGWFIKSGSEWTVAGLSAYVERGGQTWFRSPGEAPGPNTGDYNRAIRLSSYSTFIYSTFVDLFLLGDMNGNGDVDNFDISDFEMALTDSATYLANHPTLTNYAERGDIDGNGDFDNFDIKPFEDLLASGAPVGGSPSVPEPSSWVLAAIAGLALGGYRRLRR